MEITPRWFRHYVYIAFAILYIEIASIVNVAVHMPPAPEPWFTKPPVIIHIYPSPYEKDTWWNTWEERFI